MAKTGSYLHARDSGTAAAVGTAYDAAKRLSVKIDTGADSRPLHGFLEGLQVNLSSVSGAGLIAIKVTSDTAGDISVVPEITGRAIEAGFTTATDGTVIVDLGRQAWVDTTDTLYFWTKTNAGTVTVDSIRLIWGE